MSAPILVAHLLQQRLDELVQVIHLLQFAARVLVHLAVAREDVQRLQKFDRLAGADFGVFNGWCHSFHEAHFPVFRIRCNGASASSNDCGNGGNVPHIAAAITSAAIPAVSRPRVPWARLQYNCRRDFAHQRRRARDGAAHAGAPGQHTPSPLQVTSDLPACGLSRLASSSIREGWGGGRNVSILQPYPHPILPPARGKGLIQSLVQRRHVRGDLGKIVGMVGLANIQRLVVEGAGRARHMLPAHGRCAIAFGAQHGLQFFALRCRRQYADLAAHRLQREGGELAQAPGLMRAAHHHLLALDGKARTAGAPAGGGSLQGCHFAVQAQFDVRMPRQFGADLRWHHPAAAGKPQPAVRHGQTCQRRGLFRIHYLQQMRGPFLFGELIDAPGLCRGLRQLQQATFGTVHIIHRHSLIQQGQRMAVGGQHEAMQGIHAGTETRMQDAARIAGAGSGELRGALDQGDSDAALCERMCRSAAGDAAADDEGGGGNLPLSPALSPQGRGDGVGGMQCTARHLALAPEALRSLHREASLLQTAPHPACAGVGRQGRTGARGTCDARQHGLTPHLRILRGREAVEEPRIDASRWQLRQCLRDIVDRQRQPHAPTQAPAVPARHAAVPARQQHLCLHLQFRPQRQCRAQLIVIQREFLDAEEIHARTSWRCLLEQLPAHTGNSARCRSRSRRCRSSRPQTMPRSVPPGGCLAGTHGASLPDRNRWKSTRRRSDRNKVGLLSS